MSRALLALFLLFASSADAQALRVLTTALASTDPAPGDALFFYQDGQPAGLEYDILQYFAKARGMSIELRQRDDIPGMLDALERGEGDLVASSLRLTPERLNRFAGVAHFPARVLLVERQENRAVDTESLAGQTFAAVKGAAHETLLRERVPGARFVYGDTMIELMQMVERGEARGMAAAHTFVLPNLKLFPSLHTTLVLTTGESMGFLLPKGSPLAAQLDAHIQDLKTSGIFFRLVAKYFGDDAVAVVRSGREH